MQLLNDEYYMRLALQMAESAKGQTGINPVVGCVVVNHGRIVGMGAHLQRGEAHAEVHALEMAGAAAEGGTAYVTLEPCSHYGRTPPCSDKLIERGVKRVVIACEDPNPQVAGSGIAKLRHHGIEVLVGLLEGEALALNEAYNKFIVHQMPFVTLKTASTLDGKIASKTGDSKWITGEESRAYVHTLRHRHQGIMVGIDTIIADDPQLSTRLPVPAVQPIRIVVDSKLRIPQKAKILENQDIQRTIILTTAQAAPERQSRLESLGIEVLSCGNDARVNLPLAMKLLGEREISSILLEGGGRLNGAMLENHLIDKMVLFFAPKIIGGLSAPSNFSFEGIERMEDAVLLDRLKVEQIGQDVCLMGYPRYKTEEG